jgi:hypothetical protein
MSKTVDFTNLAPTSNKEEPTKKVVPQIDVKGEVKLRKKSPFKIFKDNLIENDWRTVSNHIIKNRFVPDIKRAAVEGFCTFLKSVFLGEGYMNSSRSGYYDYSSGGSYNYYYRNGGNNKKPDAPVHRARITYDDFGFPDEAVVQDIIDAMLMQAKIDGSISVGSLYAIYNDILVRKKFDPEIIAQLRAPEFTDEKFGWPYEDVCKGHPSYESGLYFLVMPRPRSI